MDVRYKTQAAVNALAVFHTGYAICLSYLIFLNQKPAGIVVILDALGIFHTGRTIRLFYHTLPAFLNQKPFGIIVILKMILTVLPRLAPVLVCAVFIVGFPFHTTPRIDALIFRASLICTGRIVIMIVDAAGLPVAVRIVDILADHLQLTGDQRFTGLVAAAVFQPFTRMARVQLTIRIVLCHIKPAVFILPLLNLAGKDVGIVIFFPDFAALFIQSRAFPTTLIVAGIVIVVVSDAARKPVAVRIQQILANQRQLACNQVIAFLAARAVLQRLRPRALNQRIILIAVAVVPAVLRVFLLARFRQRTRRQQCQREQAYRRPSEPSLHFAFSSLHFIAAGYRPYPCARSLPNSNI